MGKYEREEWPHDHYDTIGPAEAEVMDETRASEERTALREHLEKLAF